MKYLNDRLLAVALFIVLVAGWIYLAATDDSQSNDLPSVIVHQLDDRYEGTGK